MTRWLKVNSRRNSVCASARLSDLAFGSDWWTDSLDGLHFIKVGHIDGETAHRVYCRHSDTARIGMRNGELHWLVSGHSEGGDT